MDDFIQEETIDQLTSLLKSKGINKKRMQAFMNKYSSGGSTCGVLITQDRIAKEKHFDENRLNLLLSDWLRTDINDILTLEVDNLVIYYNKKASKKNRKVSKLKIISEMDNVIKGHVFISSKIGDFTLIDFRNLA